MAFVKCDLRVVTALEEEERWGETREPVQDPRSQITHLTMVLWTMPKLLGPQAVSITTVGSSQDRKDAYSLCMLAAFEFLPSGR